MADELGLGSNAGPKWLGARGGHGRQAACSAGPSCGVRIPSGEFVPSMGRGVRAKVVPKLNAAAGKFGMCLLCCNL